MTWPRMRWWHTTALFIAVLATAAVMVGCTDRPTSVTRTPGDTAPAAAARVSSSTTALRLDGQPWWPTGFNAYQIATDYSISDGCGAEVDLDAYFGALPPRSLTRFDLFAAIARDRRTDLPNYSRMDAVFDAARRHGQLVLPVLTSGEGACEDTVFKDHDWYTTGWRTRPISGRMTYEQWLITAVARWRSQPSVAGWELVGEPEPSRCRSAACLWEERSCPADSALVLARFFDRAGAVVRSLDSRRLIFSGLAGGDQCGIVGDDYLTVARSRGVDVLDFHDYSGQIQLPGDLDNGLVNRIGHARAAGKPLVVNEIGMNAGACRDLTTRADVIAAKIARQRVLGTAGALLWAYVPDPRPADCTYDIGPTDPLWGVLRNAQR